MSLNILKIYSIVAYFINKTNKYYYIVLSLYKITNKYNNKNIAAILFNIFKDYKIYSNIGYFMANNIKLNNTYINAIF